MNGIMKYYEWDYEWDIAMVFNGVQWNLMGLYSDLMDYEWDIAIN